MSEPEPLAARYLRLRIVAASLLSWLDQEGSISPEHAAVTALRVEVNMRGTQDPPGGGRDDANGG